MLRDSLNRIEDSSNTEQNIMKKCQQIYEESHFSVADEIYGTICDAIATQLKKGASECSGSVDVGSSYVIATFDNQDFNNKYWNYKNKILDYFIKKNCCVSGYELVDDIRLILFNSKASETDSLILGRKKTISIIPTENWKIIWNRISKLAQSENIQIQAVYFIKRTVKKRPKYVHDMTKELSNEIIDVITNTFSDYSLTYKRDGFGNIGIEIYICPTIKYTYCK